MKINLNDLASQFDLQQIGDSNHEIDGVATLENAQANHLSFLANSQYTSLMKDTKAGIVIMHKHNHELFKGNKLIASDPYVAYAKIASLFQKKSSSFKGIHKTVVIAENAQLEKDVIIGPYCVIGEHTIIKQGTQLEAHVTIGDNCLIGENCVIKSNVTIAYDCQLGNRVILHPGAVIGADGFGLARDVDGWIKVPQLGAVRIADDCEIGANTTIDRGTLEDTVLEKDVRLDNQIQIAHNVTIGEHTVMAGCSAVAGSAKIGKNCFIGGGVGIIGHLEVCDNVTLQSMALVTHSIKKPGSYSSVSPIQETTEWRKSAVRIKQLDKIARRLSKIEKQLKRVN
jgi:UDP-3-O-[3-hydroxymyristoyl] glucosamine N-acyltransferase